MTFRRASTKSLAGLALAALFACAALLATVAAPAGAAVPGEIRSFGTPGTGAGQFFLPQAVGVDQSDESIFVVDFNSSFSFRLRKFSSTGEELGEAEIPAEVGGAAQKLEGVAVDSTNHLLYLLGVEPEGSVEAKRIYVFSTTPTAGKLEPPSPGSGVLTAPSGVKVVDNPVGIEVDSSSGGLVLAGHDPAGHVVVQKVSAAGVAGARFTDSATPSIPEESTAPGQSHARLTGLAVAPDGAVFLSTATFVSPEFHLYELPPTLASAAIVPGVEAATAGESWKQTASVAPQAGETFSQGSQLAISPDGKTLYFAQSLEPKQNNEEGNYVIRGYSLEDERTSVVFGGGDTTCRIKTLSPAVAPLGDNGVVVADHGPPEEPQPFGAKIIEFGPGGSGCPVPATSVSVNGSSASPATVAKGTNVTLAASSTELHGATPTELLWEVSGPEPFTTPVVGTPADLSISHKFLKTGAYTVHLAMTVSGGIGVDPESPPDKTLIVEGVPPTALFNPSSANPAIGAAVSFDAAESFDPAGSSTGEQTFALANYHWDFGDGTAPVDTLQPVVSHAFATGGTKTVTLTVTNVEGLAGSSSQTLTVGSSSGGGGGSGGSSGSGGGGSTTTPPPAGGGGKPTKPAPTPLQRALAQCKKKKGKAKAQCVKKAKTKFGPKKHKH